jgi:hypothetical protein
MEQLLRSGTTNFADIEGDIQLQGEDPAQYIPAEQHENYQSHGLRVVPTSRYEVGTGINTASTDITGKQRSKHQLNSLLASAASLESQRMRNPASGSSNSAATSHRASAKRKYGW